MAANSQMVKTAVAAPPVILVIVIPAPRFVVQTTVPSVVRAIQIVQVWNTVQGTIRKRRPAIPLIKPVPVKQIMAVSVVARRAIPRPAFASTNAPKPATA